MAKDLGPTSEIGKKNNVAITNPDDNKVAASKKAPFKSAKKGNQTDKKILEMWQINNQKELNRRQLKSHWM